MSLSLLRTRLAEILRGAALIRYERDLRQQTAELNDLFLLLCFMEAAGMPNPAYAMDDQTAITVVDGAVEFVSEGQWLQLPTLGSAPGHV